MRTLSGVSELEDWVLHGATWRPVTIEQRRVVVELCTCSGEPVDRVESNDGNVIEYVRNHHAQER